MRRLLLMTGGLSLTIAIGLGGVANANTTARVVKSGTLGTFSYANGDCQDVQFAGHKTFTATNTDEGGRYSGGGKKITMVWNTGSDTGNKFVGHLIRGTAGYSGDVRSKTGTVLGVGSLATGPDRGECGIGSA